MSVIEYYNKTGAGYCEKAIKLDMSDHHARFSKYLVKGAHILDAGCGSGRDTKALSSLGFSVYPIDGSIEVVKFASDYIGTPVTCLSFEEVEFRECFDAIWANVSLLHHHPADLDNVFPRLLRSLRPGGFGYMSFKYGEGEETIGDIAFYLKTEKTLKAFIDQFPELKIEELWTWSRQNLLKGPSKWIGCIVQKLKHTT